jgi:hypothetical protein
MPNTFLRQQVAEREALIGRAVVGHDPLDRHAEALEPIQRTARESDGAFSALVRKNFTVGHAGRVIDRHVEKFPARATLVALPRAIAGDAMADAINAAELLDVDVDQFAGPVALIANDQRFRIQRAQPSEAETTQQRSDR